MWYGHVEAKAANSTRTRKVDVRLPGKGNSNSHGARPVHQIISMTAWLRTSELSIHNSLSTSREGAPGPDIRVRDATKCWLWACSLRILVYLVIYDSG